MLDLFTRLRLTPLNDLHLSRGGRLVPFAGWSLPVQFPAGIIAEVHQCRRAAALFDVSHMAQIELHGAHGDAALERLLPADLLELPEGRQVYTQLLNEAGGIIDDLMVGRLAGGLRLVVNASRATVDLAHLRAALPASITIIPRDDLALLALQGPRAAAALERLVPNVAALPFMGVGRFRCSGFDTVIARCGYTGEDGFEIALPADRATDFAEQLLALPDVARTSATQPPRSRPAWPGRSASAAAATVAFPATHGSGRKSPTDRPAAWSACDPTAAHPCAPAPRSSLKSKPPSATSPPAPFRQRSTRRSPWATCKPPPPRPSP
jgi:hypothetical protein